MMDVSNKYNIFIGTSRGVLIRTSCVKQEKVSHFVSDQSSSTSEITALEWGPDFEKIIIGYKSGHAALYDVLNNKITKHFNNLEGAGGVSGVAYIGSTLVTARQDGIINIWDGKEQDYFSTNLVEKGSLDYMIGHKSRVGTIATGGEHNDFKLWDIESRNSLFKAKSLGHDELNLPIPTSIRGIACLPEPTLHLVATKEGHVLLYDERAQRRPVVKYLEKKASFTCISSAYRERQCLVGTTKGYMQLLDMKVPGKCLKTFVNFTGSVTSIACDPTEPVVVSTSLDRFLRINHLETKELLHKEYLKQNLTKVLLKPIVKEEKPEQTENREVDEEFEEIFNNMETVAEKKIKRKTTILEYNGKTKKTKHRNI